MTVVFLPFNVMQAFDLGDVARPVVFNGSHSDWVTALVDMPAVHGLASTAIDGRVLIWDVARATIKLELDGTLAVADRCALGDLG